MNFDYRGIFGFDVSTHQDSPLIAGHIDFQKMRDYGASFCFIKASEGNFTDIDFAINWGGAKGLLVRSPYHYYNNFYPPKIQANQFWNTIKGDFEGIAWLDLEDRKTGYLGWRHWYDFLVELQSISKLPDDQIGIYSGLYYLEEFLLSASQTQREWFTRFDLWLANYSQDPFKPNYEAIRIPFNLWSECLVLQTGTPVIGLQAGVESKEIDYNHFNGDVKKFADRFGFGIPVPPPIVVNPPPAGIEPETEKQLWHAEVTVNTKLHVRNYPVVTDASRTGFYVFNGNEFQGRLWTGNGYVWMKIDAPSYPDLHENWVAVRSTNGSDKFIALTKAGSVITPEPPPVITLPAGRFFARGLHDYETEAWLLSRARFSVQRMD